MEDWFDSCICESFVACIIALNEVVCSLALDGFSEDDIGITVVKNKDVTVTLHTLPWKHAGEVCADEAL